MSYRTPAALEMAIKDAARRSEMDTGRAIESFYYHRFLCRVFSDPNSRFVLKGGRSVLARTTRARYSRDADFAAVEMTIDEAVMELERLASLSLDDFVSFELSDSKPIRIEDEYREGVRLSFGTSLGVKKMRPITVDLVVDRVPSEEIDRVTPVDRLNVKNIRVCDYKVVSVPFALADKFCAILETHAGRASSRVKDLVDILVYMETEAIDTEMLGLKLDREAKLRHIALPEHFAIPANWTRDYSAVYARMIREVSLEENYPSLSEGTNAAAELFESAIVSASVIR